MLAVMSEMLMGRRLFLWGPVVAIALTVAVLSHQPVPPGPSVAPDWLLHFGEFAVLAFVLARALAGGLNWPVTFWVAAFAALMTAAYGVLDEVHQSFVPFRDPSLGDVAADVVGSVAGVWVAAGVARIVGRRRRTAPSGPGTTTASFRGCS